MSTLASQTDERIQARELEVEQLALERDRYADLFAFAPEAYLVSDAYGIIMEANAAAGRLLQAAPESLRGRALDLFVPLEQRRVFRGRLAAMAAGGGVERTTWRGGVRCAHTDVGVEFTAGCIRHRSLPMLSLCWLLRPLQADPARLFI
jgi:PAS domain S-box-containing protein